MHLAKALPTLLIPAKRAFRVGPARDIPAYAGTGTDAVREPAFLFMVPSEQPGEIVVTSGDSHA